MSNEASGRSIRLTTDLSDREREMILAGGRLNYIKSRV